MLYTPLYHFNAAASGYFFQNFFIGLMAVPENLRAQRGGNAVIGQYISKNYMESKRRPHYIVKETNKNDKIKRIG